MCVALVSLHCMVVVIPRISQVVGGFNLCKGGLAAVSRESINFVGSCLS